MALVGVTILAGLSSGQTNAQLAADTVFLDGQVLLYPNGGSLMSHLVSWAQAVAVKDGRIAFVGNNDGAKRRIGPNTRVVDLKGRILMPGLGDGHLHGGTEGSTCPMDYEGGTVDEVLAKLKACLLRHDQVAHLKSKFVLRPDQFNVNGMAPAGTAITRQDLDRLSKEPSKDEFGTGTTRPIVIRDMGGHQTFTNTAAIVNGDLNEKTAQPPGAFIGRDPNGYPNGQFSDFSAKWGPSVPEERDAAYRATVADYRNANRVGITLILHPGGDVESLQVLKRVADDGNLTVRVNQAISAFEIRGETDPAAVDKLINGLNDVRRQYDGYRSPASPGDIAVDTVKVSCDGIAEFPGQTGAMLEPYRVNSGTIEKPVFVPGNLKGEDPSCSDATLGFDKLDQAKWTIHVHAIGDRATRDALDNFEASQAKNEPWDRRHTITHLEFVRDEDMARLAGLGVVASMSTVWFQRDMWTVTATEGFIAPDSMDDIYPAGGLVRGGAVLAIGNDWPVHPPWKPWTAIEQTATREGRANPKRAIFSGPLSAHHALTFPQAVKAGTIGVAYQMHRDDETGSIQEGKLADLIVIDKDLRPLFTVSGALMSGNAQARSAHMKAVYDANVAATKTLLTMVGGKVVFTDPGL
ncbi:MAG TPA: amidohydrolase family protein [Vicinamibacteria bacterium]|nr:amidohydrolase family protein [Vicinamibacteria bacterium]